MNLFKRAADIFAKHDVPIENDPTPTPGGDGDMTKEVYDPDEAVADAGGIAEYVEAHSGESDIFVVKFWDEYNEDDNSHIIHCDKTVSEIAHASKTKAVVALVSGDPSIFTDFESVEYYEVYNLVNTYIDNTPTFEVGNTVHFAMYEIMNTFPNVMADIFVREIAGSDYKDPLNPSIVVDGWGCAEFVSMTVPTPMLQEDDEVRILVARVGDEGGLFLDWELKESV